MAGILSLVTPFQDALNALALAVYGTDSYGSVQAAIAAINTNVPGLLAFLGI